MEDNEIDLRPLLRAVVRGWPIIVLTALLLAIPAAAMRMARQRAYQAHTEIAIVRSQPQANFQSNISEEQATDPNTLREGLVQLAQSGAVAQLVIEQMGSSLPSALNDAVNLQKLVQVTARNNTDLIQIGITSDNPDMSKAIVEAWARAFVQRANAVFGKQTVADLEEGLEQARTKFQSKQEALVSSRLPREIAQLERDAATLQSALATVRSSQLSLITNTLTDQANQQAELLKLYSNAFYDSHTIPLASEQQSKRDELKVLYDTAARLRLLLGDIASFREQVAQGSTSGSSLAYNLIKTQLFAGSTALLTNVQPQLATTEVPSLADLDVLFTNTETRLKQVEDQIASLSSELREGTAYNLPQFNPDNDLGTAFQEQLDSVLSQRETGNLVSSLVVTQTGGMLNDPRLQQLETQFQDFQQELERKRGEFFLLQQERDLAKANYTAIATRITELQAASTEENTIVRAIGASVVEPVAKGTVRQTGLAFGLGLLLGTLIVLIRAFVPSLLKETDSAAVPQRA